MLRIKELRTEKNLTQIEFGARCGVSQAIVSQWETENTLPRTRDLPHIAEVLGVEIGELFNPNPCPDHEEYGFNS